jgi:hypothetical protein
LVLSYSIGIFSLVPIARGIQRVISDIVGREFFIYLTIFPAIIGVAIIFYTFIFKLKVREISQYIWLISGISIYTYYIMELKSSPEEAIHFLEYGLLPYFIFRALSHRIKDWTVYISTLLYVALIGISDEFLQWLMPHRVWDFRDIGFNIMAGGIFIISLWKGIRPEIISMPVKKDSVRTLIRIFTIDLIFIGLCFSNTPGFVNKYTDIFHILGWLRNEEPMIEFGYRHIDPDLGIFYSRLTLEELKKIDLLKGRVYGEILLKEGNPEIVYRNLIKAYNQYTNPFLYEFLIHFGQRNNNYREFIETEKLDEKIEESNISLKENLILEKYFKNTLKYSNLSWSDKRVNELKNFAYLAKKDYVSEVGSMITFLSLKTIWLMILIVLFLSFIFEKNLEKYIKN